MGFDAGLEQAVFKLLESAPVEYDALVEVEAAVERDAVVDFPESHRKELDRRLAAADADPAAGRPWKEVWARLREK